MMLTEEEYSKAFDIYLDNGKVPQSWENDPICKYVKGCAMDKKSQERCWTDMMTRKIQKDSLMDFIHYLMWLFEEAEAELNGQLHNIARLMESEKGKNEELFEALEDVMAQAEGEVNLEGYKKMLQKGTGDEDLILKMVRHDCEETCRQSMRQKIEQLMKMLSMDKKNNAKNNVSRGGDEDEEMIEEWDMVAEKYPVIEKIVKIMGREMPSDEDTESVPISHYMPQLLSPAKVHTEVDGVTTGNDVPLALPSEIALMADTQADWLFYQKFAANKLQLFSCRPPVDIPDMKTEDEQQLPRPDKGPIIVAIDTSGSMFGEPEKIAKAMLVQLVRMALEQHRKCFIVSWSVRAESIELTQDGSLSKLKDFLSHQFSGGNDESLMLQMIFKALDSDDYGMADVLMISDFYIEPPSNVSVEQIEADQDDGTRFYGLEISDYSLKPNPYQGIFDKIWKHNLYL